MLARLDRLAVSFGRCVEQQSSAGRVNRAGYVAEGGYGASVRCFVGRTWGVGALW